MIVYNESLFNVGVVVLKLFQFMDTCVFNNYMMHYNDVYCAYMLVEKCSRWYKYRLAKTYVNAVKIELLIIKVLNWHIFTVYNVKCLYIHMGLACCSLHWCLHL